MENKRILIIAYKFPPMGGIGTRRWAKFAKYFTKLGYEVHILTIKYNKLDKINWYNDIKDNNKIIIHKIDSGYPNWLLDYSKNSIIAIFQKALNIFFKRSFFYIDIAQRWAKHMLPKAKKIILENNIKNVIVTNPPPSVSYISSYLKIDLPYINLIQDFRDSWNDDIDYNFPNTLKFFYQKEKSVYMEWFVVHYSDYIINVTQDITNRVKNKYKTEAEKFYTIYNGFDFDDIKNLTLRNNINKKIKIIYTGGLGLGRIKAIELIMDVLLEIPLEKLKNLEINIYASFNKKKLNKEYCKLIDEIIFFHKLIPTNKIFEEIAIHDYALSINAPIYSYAFGTKIFDYMMLNKNIIHISNGGELFNILKKAGQFVSTYDKNSINNIFNTILTNKNTINNKKFMYEKFNIDNLTKEYEKFLR